MSQGAKEESIAETPHGWCVGFHPKVEGHCGVFHDSVHKEDHFDHNYSKGDIDKSAYQQWGATSAGKGSYSQWGLGDVIQCYFGNGEIWFGLNVASYDFCIRTL